MALIQKWMNIVEYLESSSSKIIETSGLLQLSAYSGDEKRRRRRYHPMEYCLNYLQLMDLLLNQAANELLQIFLL